jgi:ferredoxin
MPEYMTWKDRRKVENFLDMENSAQLGLVEINTEKCTGCGHCTKACAASFLVVKDKKCQLNLDIVPAACISCGDCVAICPEDAIDLVQFLEYKLAFRPLDRGVAKEPRNF